MLHQPIQIPTAPRQLVQATYTIAAYVAVAEYAKLRGDRYVRAAAIACIDAIEGEQGFDLHECEGELFDAIEDRRDAPCFWAVMRNAPASGFGN